MKKLDLVSKKLNDLMFTRKTAMEQLPSSKKKSLASMNLDERAERRGKIKQIWDKFNRPFIYYKFDAKDYALDAELSLNCRDYWIYEYYTNPFNHAYLFKDDIKGVCQAYNFDVADLKEHRDYVVANLDNDRYYDYYSESLKHNESMLAWFPEIEEHVHNRIFSKTNQQKFEKMCSEIHQTFYNKLIDWTDYQLDGYEGDFDYEDFMPSDSGDIHDWLDKYCWKNFNLLCIGNLLLVCDKYSVDYSNFRQFCLPIYKAQNSYTQTSFDDLFSPAKLDRFPDVTDLVKDKMNLN